MWDAGAVTSCRSEIHLVRVQVGFVHMVRSVGVTLGVRELSVMAIPLGMESLHK